MAVFAVAFVLGDAKGHQQVGDEGGEQEMARHVRILHAGLSALRTDNGRRAREAGVAAVRPPALQALARLVERFLGHIHVNCRMPPTQEPPALPADLISQPGGHARGDQARDQRLAIAATLEGGQRDLRGAGQRIAHNNNVREIQGGDRSGTEG